MADALSSAAKRRMHLEPGTEHVGLDQIGEALLPLALFARPLSLGLGGGHRCHGHSQRARYRYSAIAPSTVATVAAAEPAEAGTFYGNFTGHSNAALQ